MKNTSIQFKEIISVCRDLYTKKLQDYGPAWRVLRLPSLTDQIFIKVNRIRTLQEAAERLVDEDEEGEFVAIVNYSIMALIQLELGFADQPDLTDEQAIEFYDKYATIAHDLMMKKNHDYGEAWRDMRISSITDLIYQKVLRTKSIEDNKGKTIVSEGLDANYLDMINYSIFAMILINEKKAS